MVEQDIIEYMVKQERNAAKELTEKETLDFLDERLKLEAKYGNQLANKITEYQNANVSRDIKKDLIHANFEIDMAKSDPEPLKPYRLDFIAPITEDAIVSSEAVPTPRTVESWSDPRIRREIIRYKQLVKHIKEFLKDYPNTTEWLGDALTHLAYKYKGMIAEYERMNNDYFSEKGDFLENTLDFVDKEMMPLFQKTADFIIKVDKMLDNSENDRELVFLTKIRDILEA